MKVINIKIEIADNNQIVANTIATEGVTFLEYINTLKHILEVTNKKFVDVCVEKRLKTIKEVQELRLEP